MSKKHLASQNTILFIFTLQFVILNTLNIKSFIFFSILLKYYFYFIQVRQRESIGGRHRTRESERERERDKKKEKNNNKKTLATCYSRVSLQ